VAEKDDRDIAITGLSWALALLLLPAAVAFKAFALHLLWGWFATPAFGVPSPGVPRLAGLALMAALVWPTGPDATERNPVLSVCASFVGTALLLGLGWLLSLFV
jgi:hypothetical protein